ncbi:hypothetical protein EJB05_22092, partial [Eragrostis curvula]
MDAADKQGGLGGGMLRSSGIWKLAVLSTAFWTLVFYVHSCMQGGDGVGSVLLKKSTSSPPPLLSSDIAGRRAPPHQQQEVQSQQSVTAPADDDRCAGRYIYMYDMPPRFNDDLVRGCSKLSPWTDLCWVVANCGMGTPLNDQGGFLQARGWYATDQFMLDIISHCRMKRYECLTGDASRAAALYVPFYAALDAGRYFFNSTSARDALPLDFADWLARRPEWQATGGRDHFMVAGRTSWDYRRKADVDEEWGNKLLNLPVMQNMTALILEETSKTSRNTIPIPYPTYFHPETAADVAAWQEKVRGAERKWLFSFVGGARPPSSHTVRAEIIQQCDASSRCEHADCGSGACSWPSGVMRVFQSSDFCLEPSGDTPTRRSTFDSIMAGCIPVFFQPDSAYTQYTLHLPKDPDSWSVLIMHTDITGRNVSIEETLSKIPPEKVKAMREEVIRLIPKVVYADPRSSRVDFKDAFDVALEAVFDRVAKRRQGAATGDAN